MRKFLFAASAATTLLVSAAASADTFTQDVDIRAVVDNSCSCQTPTATSGFTSHDANASTLLINVNPTTGVALKTESLTYSNMVCNGASTKVTLSRSGLYVSPGTIVNNAFSRRIDYTVAVNWGTAPAVLLDVDELEKEAMIGRAHV